MRADGRLGREGRLLRTVVGFSLLVAAIVFGPRAFADDPTGGAHAESVAYDTYTVAPGDTLWGIARVIAPEASAESTVAEIMRLNEMTSASVQPWEQIRIPVAS